MTVPGRLEGTAESEAVGERAPVTPTLPFKSALMDRAGARTRFQADARAVRRGRL
ncbi:hypothetical protein ABZ816_22345 [Actinosynnema sp. NPDC047251]|uniref:Uncharacterized protein n=1 Tax=Saccharothrix espanaensis (strain ATCC 51144 / DSM 44229 / JCM 9112 / NBRC 15066 / NRRL 15764) TaxID=1179773 RepID=K0KAM5_SACES|nr:hypothetical protein [Saccharothrix espanaensis]CCH33658.1 hypothetical protein BN6_64150 [Saccharothrix espanaensis DSM 44229]